MVVVVDEFRKRECGSFICVEGGKLFTFEHVLSICIRVFTPWALAVVWVQPLEVEGKEVVAKSH